MVLVSHPLGNQNVRGVLRGLKDTGMLSCYTTSIASFKDTALYNAANRISFLNEINKRSYDTDMEMLTRTWPVMEVARMVATKAKISKLTAHETGRFSVDKVCHYIDKKTAALLRSKSIKDLKAVYAYEDIALETFIQAHSLGLKNIYDLPIGYWRAARALMQGEMESRPEWAPTMVGFMDSEVKLQRKDNEIALADHIFVASSFTAKTLEYYPGKLPEISVVPYGFPKTGVNKEYSSNGPLKILFVGGLSQRKGLANLFEAASYFGNAIELTVVGHRIGSHCEPLENGLKNCTYIPGLPHAEILKLMRTQDVFVFPSLFEGFGLVITEAMSQGVPVITTERTIGPDIIKHNQNGWLTEAGNTESLKAALSQILDDRSLVKRCGQAAFETAQGRPWEKYEKETAEKIISLIKQ